MISGDIRVAMTVLPGSAASTHFKISDTQVSHRQEGVTVITPVTVYECKRVIIVVTKSPSSSVILPIEAVTTLPVLRFKFPG
ncbi:MAG: hypothetical protein WBE61_14265 [Nitrososphaeraceae archaeon]